jgi:hypothetical protein
MVAIISEQTSPKSEKSLNGNPDAHKQQSTMEQEKSDDCKEEKMKNYTFIRK